MSPERRQISYPTLEALKYLCINQSGVCFSFLYHYIKYHILYMSKIQCDTKQQNLKIVNFHFLKSE